MKTAQQIKTELEEIKKQLSEFNEMRASSKDKLDALQNKISAESLHLDAVQAQLGRLGTLDSSIKTLTEKEAELKQELAAAVADTARAAMLAELKTFAETALQKQNAVLEIRSEFDEMISEFVERLYDARREMNLAKNGFESTLRRHFPGFNGFDRESDAKAQREVDKAVQGLDVNSAALSAAMSRNVNVPPARFGQHVHMLESYFAAEQERRQRSQYKAA